MAFDAHKNFAYSTVATAPSPATSGTSLVVQTGDGTKYPTPPFNATIWPSNAQPTIANSEIVRVTAVSTDTLTITRTQESTSARTVVVGDQIADTITAKVLTDIEAATNPTGTINSYAGRTAPTNWLFCDGSNVSRATYATLFGIIAPTVGTFTVTIATPAVVTLSAHGFLTGDSVYLTTTGALPTGLTANTLYYVVKVDANTFNLATSAANAAAGTKIATSGTQSGTHTLNACPYGLGDGSTTFGLPDLRGRVPAGNDSMSGTAALRLTNPTTVTVNGVYGNLGAAGGFETHQLTVAQLANHKHVVNKAGTAGGDGTGLAWSSNSTSNSAHEASGTGSDSSHNNMQPTLIVNYIIKT